MYSHWAALRANPLLRDLDFSGDRLVGHCLNGTILGGGNCERVFRIIQLVTSRGNLFFNLIGALFKDSGNDGTVCTGSQFESTTIRFGNGEYRVGKLDVLIAFFNLDKLNFVR